MTPTLILIITAATLARLPADIAAEVQRCEKAYHVGRYYVTVPRALWDAVTARLAAMQAQEQPTP